MTIIYPQQRTDQSKSISNSQNLLFENFDQVALEEDPDKVQAHKPKIIAQSLLSKCQTINKDTQYEVAGLNS